MFTTILIVSIIIVLVVLLLAVVTTSRAYSYKHSVDPISHDDTNSKESMKKDSEE